MPRNERLINQIYFSREAYGNTRKTKGKVIALLNGLDIGSVGFSYKYKNRSLKIGYSDAMFRVIQGYNGNGLGEELAIRVLELASQYIDGHPKRVSLTTLDSNDEMIEIAKRIGFIEDEKHSFNKIGKELKNKSPNVHFSMVYVLENPKNYGF